MLNVHTFGKVNLILSPEKSVFVKIAIVTVIEPVYPEVNAAGEIDATPIDATLMRDN